ncbi:MAG TPA: 50S ribosomal protein L11 methyltransferase [Tissierellaceae bacterium]|nr:50S ribosomal protein L11 methyltransferase [Tissierellaceae bacterium]
MKWAEIQIKTTHELEDLITGILYDVGATGLAIEDPKDILELVQSEISWDFVDPSLTNLDINQIIIKAYFAEDEELEDIIQNVRDKIKQHPMLKEEENKLAISFVSEKDWAESWKKYYKPIRIGKNILIKPTWEEADIDNKTVLVELDPGMAFGTGTHETTIMCAEALEKHVKPGDLVYDIGCGSGILSIVSAKLGARKVVGVDLDPVCVRVSTENVKINNVEDIVKVKMGDLLEFIQGDANVIVSNIIAEIIGEMVPNLRNHLKDDGIFIASGIIIDKIPYVKNALLENNFTILDIVKRNEWVCITSAK